jgi:cobalt-zinc-cadmium efflux system outer membrane protein
VERAFGEYRVAQSQVDMFKDGIVLQAEAAVDAAQAAFQFGERGIIEVLDAQRVLRTARLEYMNAQYDRQQALIALEQLGALDLTGSNP